MNHFITIQVSCPTYWGFKYKIPRVYSVSVPPETLVQELKIVMKEFFNTHNLEELKNGVDNLNLHIHGPIDPSHDVIYACSHI